jgi:2-keto-4-pentenoate hydratase/2-oxohepta-3-ene-1,7-dioic acid hydratase in catechol pathway
VQFGGRGYTDQTPYTPQPSARQLTSHALALHEKTFDHILHTAQTIVKALDIHDAAKDLSIDLPFKCFVNDKSQLDGWIFQQAK